MNFAEFEQQFIPYLDPETENDENGKHKNWADQSLVKNAPQSAIDAFEEFKKKEIEARKQGIIYN